MDMQIFGSAILPFNTTKQTIVTQGVATFLNSGVTASQIILTVENTIAGVSMYSGQFPACYPSFLAVMSF